MSQSHTMPESGCTIGITSNRESTSNTINIPDEVGKIEREHDENEQRSIDVDENEYFRALGLITWTELRR